MKTYAAFSYGVIPHHLLRNYLVIIIYICVCAQSLKSCLTLCDPMHCSPPGSPVYGTFQAGILEWVAISYSTFLW